MCVEGIEVKIVFVEDHQKIGDFSTMSPAFGFPFLLSSFSRKRQFAFFEFKARGILMFFCKETVGYIPGNILGKGASKGLLRSFYEAEYRSEIAESKRMREEAEQKIFWSFRGS